MCVCMRVCAHMSVCLYLIAELVIVFRGRGLETVGVQYVV